MRGLKKNCTRWRRQADMATIRPTRPSGAELVKIQYWFKIWGYNNLRGLKRNLERFGWLERCSGLECFGWLVCHFMSDAMESLDWKAFILHGKIFLNSEFNDVSLVSNDFNI